MRMYACRMVVYACVCVCMRANAYHQLLPRVVDLMVEENEDGVLDLVVRFDIFIII